MKKITLLLVLIIPYFNVLAQANDNCSGAIELQPNVVQSGSLNTASNSGITPSCSFFNGDYWYSFTAGSTQEISITSSTGFAIYSDCSGANEILCSANSTNNLLVQSLTSGQTYYIQLFTNPEPCRRANCGEYEILITGETLSTKQLNNSQFNVYPNPVQNNLTISAQSQINSIEVYDILGKKVLTKRPNLLITELDLSTFSKGYYMVRLSTNSNSQVIKIVKE